MPVQCKELRAAAGPGVFDDDVLAEIGGCVVGHDFVNDAIEHTEHVVMRHKRRLFALKILVRRTIRENDARRLARRRDVYRRDIATAMKSFPAIPRPPWLAIVGIHARACEESFRRVKQMTVRRRPGDADRFPAWQRDEFLIARYGLHNQRV